MGLFDFFLGKYVVSTDEKNAVKLLNICMTRNIEYRSPKFRNGRFSISCHRGDYKALCEICPAKEIELLSERRSGAPKMFSKYKYRFGLLAGAILGLAIVMLALNVVWRVDVSGNERFSADRVREILCEHNFGVGSFIGKADFTEIENRIMEDNRDIAWISININGTVAKVEVRETKKGGQRPEGVSDLVAARDGKIERIEAYDGNCVVKVGDVVRAGDVLVSGKYSDDGSDTRETWAEGEIYARTVRSFLIEIPFENSEKVYTGRKYREIYINFFEKRIKVFANTGNLPPTCDIIYKSGRVGLSDIRKIPVGLEKTEYIEYEMRHVTLDETRAMEKAFSELDKRMESLAENVELLEKNVEFEISETAYVLKCSLVCIENIAVRR